MLIDVGLILGIGLLMYELSEPLLSHLGDSRNCFKDDYVLVIGHAKGLFKTPITVDMNIDSHVLIIGHCIQSGCFGPCCIKSTAFHHAA